MHFHSSCRHGGRLVIPKECNLWQHLNRVAQQRDKWPNPAFQHPAPPLQARHSESSPSPDTKYPPWLRSCAEPWLTTAPLLRTKATRLPFNLKSAHYCRLNSRVSMELRQNITLDPSMFPSLVSTFSSPSHHVKTLPGYRWGIYSLTPT